MKNKLGPEVDAQSWERRGSAWVLEPKFFQFHPVFGTTQFGMEGESGGLGRSRWNKSLKC